MVCDYPYTFLEIVGTNTYVVNHNSGELLLEGNIKVFSTSKVKSLSSTVSVIHNSLVK